MQLELSVTIAGSFWFFVGQVIEVSVVLCWLYKCSWLVMSFNRSMCIVHTIDFFCCTVGSMNARWMCYYTFNVARMVTFLSST